MDIFNTFDELVDTTFINLYSFGKGADNIIPLINYSHKNLGHRCILNIAFIVSNNFPMQIGIGCSRFKFILFKIKHLFNKKYKGIVSYSCNHNIPSVDELIEFMTTERKVPRDIFEDIYKAYYKKGKK